MMMTGADKDPTSDGFDSAALLEALNSGALSPDHGSAFAWVVYFTSTPSIIQFYGPDGNIVGMKPFAPGDEVVASMHLDLDYTYTIRLNGQIVTQHQFAPLPEDESLRNVYVHAVPSGVLTEPGGLSNLEVDIKTTTTGTLTTHPYKLDPTTKHFGHYISETEGSKSTIATIPNNVNSSSNVFETATQTSLFTGTTGDGKHYHYEIDIADVTAAGYLALFAIPKSPDYDNLNLSFPGAVEVVGITSASSDWLAEVIFSSDGTVMLSTTGVEDASFQLTGIVKISWDWVLSPTMLLYRIYVTQVIDGQSLHYGTQMSVPIESPEMEAELLNYMLRSVVYTIDSMTTNSEGVVTDRPISVTHELVDSEIDDVDIITTGGGVPAGDVLSLVNVNSGNYTTPTSVTGWESIHHFDLLYNGTQDEPNGPYLDIVAPHAIFKPNNSFGGDWSALITPRYSGYTYISVFSDQPDFTNYVSGDLTGIPEFKKLIIVRLVHEQGLEYSVYDELMAHQISGQLNSPPYRHVGLFGTNGDPTNPVNLVIGRPGSWLVGGDASDDGLTWTSESAWRVEGITNPHFYLWTTDAGDITNTIHVNYGHLRYLQLLGSSYNFNSEQGNGSIVPTIASFAFDQHQLEVQKISYRQQVIEVEGISSQGITDPVTMSTWYNLPELIRDGSNSRHVMIIHSNPQPKNVSLDQVSLWVNSLWASMIYAPDGSILSLEVVRYGTENEGILWSDFTDQINYVTSPDRPLRLGITFNPSQYRITISLVSDGVIHYDTANGLDYLPYIEEYMGVYLTEIVTVGNYDDQTISNPISMNSAEMLQMSGVPDEYVNPRIGYILPKFDISAATKSTALTLWENVIYRLTVDDHTVDYVQAPTDLVRIINTVFIGKIRAKIDNDAVIIWAIDPGRPVRVKMLENSAQASPIYSVAHTINENSTLQMLGNDIQFGLNAVAVHDPWVTSGGIVNEMVVTTPFYDNGKIIFTPGTSEYPTDNVGSMTLRAGEAVALSPFHTGSGNSDLVGDGASGGFTAWVYPGNSSFTDGVPNSQYYRIEVTRDSEYYTVKLYSDVLLQEFQVNLTTTLPAHIPIIGLVEGDGSNALRAGVITGFGVTTYVDVDGPGIAYDAAEDVLIQVSLSDPSGASYSNHWVDWTCHYDAYNFFNIGYVDTDGVHADEVGNISGKVVTITGSDPSSQVSVDVTLDPDVQSNLQILPISLFDHYYVYPMVQYGYSGRIGNVEGTNTFRAWRDTSLSPGLSYIEQYLISSDAKASGKINDQNNLRNATLLTIINVTDDIHRFVAQVFDRNGVLIAREQYDVHGESHRLSVQWTPFEIVISLEYLISSVWTLTYHNFTTSHDLSPMRYQPRYIHYNLELFEYQDPAITPLLKMESISTS